MSYLGYMRIGTCRLCLSTGELRKSHFIPKSAYKRIQQSDGEPPIAIQQGVTIQTNQQIADYVFCGACEEIFNRNGEDWVMRNCFQHAQGFRLKELIDGASPIADNGLKVYSARQVPEIDIEKLSYFAASIIWRAAVHNWTFGKRKVNRLYLGPYAEELRRFLLRETGFPTNAVVWVSIISEPKLWGSFVVPYGDKLNQCRRYKFSFLGLRFDFFLGKLIDRQIRRMCTHRSDEKLLYAGDPASEIIIEDLSRLIVKSRPLGALKERIESD